jgi:hypothetical protein
MADPTLAQGRRLARSLTSSSANNTSASPNATNATRFLTVFSSWFGQPTAGASLPRRPPGWPTRAVAQVRAGRGSTLPLRCRLGTLHPAGPADLLADRRIAARTLPGSRAVRSSLRSGTPVPLGRPPAPLTPPGPARCTIQRRPRWARNSRPASSKGR